MTLVNPTPQQTPADRKEKLDHTHTRRASDDIQLHMDALLIARSNTALSIQHGRLEPALDTNEEICSLLHHRWLANGLHLMSVGSSAWVSIRPSPAMVTEICAPIASAEKAAACKAKPEFGLNHQPHLLDIASSAYLHMRAEHGDQTIILSGEDDTGKASALAALSRHLVDLGHINVTGKRSRISTLVHRCHAILSAFGSLTDVQVRSSEISAPCPDAASSAFIRYEELQFSQSGELVGIKFIPYLLQTAHVSSSIRRNFTVLYGMVEGATADERSLWHLNKRDNQTGRLSIYSWDTLRDFKYTEGADTMAPGALDKLEEEFVELRGHLRALGMDAELQGEVFQVLASILHLGNITFKQAPTQISEDGVVVQNMQDLAVVAELLGLDALAIEAAITTRSKNFSGDIVSINLDLDAAVRQRDCLAQAIYAALFVWISEHLNHQLCRDESYWSQYISIMDVPGFDARTHLPTPEHSIATESYYQIIVNYSNELLQEMSLKHYNTYSKQLAAENITTCTSLSDKSVDSSISKLMHMSHIGILPLLNSETICGNEAQNDAAFVASVAHHASEHTAVCISHKPNVSFTIQHFGSANSSTACDYVTTGWTMLNTDLFQSGIVTLFRGTFEDPGTTSQFIRSLFSSHVISTQADEASGVSTAPTDHLFRPSSTHPKHSVEGSLQPSESGSQPTVALKRTLGHQLISDFSGLLDVVSNTKQWNLFSIRQSDLQSVSPMWDHSCVERQINSLPLLSISQSPFAPYSSTMTHEMLFNRYEIQFRQYGISFDDRNPSNACVQLAIHMGWGSSDVLCLSTAVFLSEASWRLLESILVQSSPLDVSHTGEVSYVNPYQHRLGLEGHNPHISVTPPPGEYPPIDHYTRLAFVDIANWSSEASNKATSQDTLVGDSEASTPIKSEFGNSSNDLHRKTLLADNVYPATSRKGLEVSWATPSRGICGSRFSRWCRPLKRQGQDGLFRSIHSPPKASPRSANKEAISTTRYRWLCCTWLLTWWIPSYFLKWCGCMKLRDRQIAWREKTAFCILIALLNAAVLMLIIGSGPILCPDEAQLSPRQISSLNQLDPHSATVYMYGNYHAAYDIAKSHLEKKYPNSQDAYWSASVLGQDVSAMFSKESAWSTYCPAFPRPPRQFQLFPDDVPRFKSPAWVNHNPPNSTKDALSASTIKDSIKGTVVWDEQDIKDWLTIKPSTNRMAIAYDRVYDLSPFFAQAYVATKRNFLGLEMANILTSAEMDGSIDSTQKFEAIRISNPALWGNVMQCLDGLFYVGRVDHRNDFRCQVSNYILLSISCVIVLVLLIKFIASLQFGPAPVPDVLNKFVICQVPCYTENEDSLRRTLESVAALDYNDHQKLLFIVADGMIIGAGNDRPTPRIVLDILGVDSAVQPKSFAFHSLGNGTKQLNYVGKPSERTRPGNRGKRDSQLILMQFLSRAHYTLSMNPLELELYHHMEHIIGISPLMYEFILMVDADTNVYKTALSQLVSCMVQDSKIIGVCGETRLSNDRDSWVTMIQVYEYFISHHLVKAFESLFGSVTCLPGCFSMYRIRSATGNKPLMISQSILQDYSINKVDTLHLKNLLHLGEDRYLTTLMMKHFPKMRTKYTPYALSETIAPDKWGVFQSQRRRWINSTVHNLMELCTLPNLCGTCCFTMRFVVLFDLMATLIQPATLVYLAYLISQCIIDDTRLIPIVSILMIAAIYGLQVILFVVKREVHNLGWMLIYLLAVPLFTFYLPIYSFWSLDDFSWGNTRLAIEQDGRRVEKVVEEESFDAESIPRETWKAYLARLNLDTIEPPLNGSFSVDRSLSSSSSSSSSASSSQTSSSSSSQSSEVVSTMLPLKVSSPRTHIGLPALQSDFSLGIETSFDDFNHHPIKNWDVQYPVAAMSAIIQSELTQSESTSSPSGSLRIESATPVRTEPPVLAWAPPIETELTSIWVDVPNQTSI
ncbi:hypothetical protein BASA50_009339 [Batrachochytrium salamandrivorans]|uniref:chitin synthase n=1 Tax=Batrachochytrium salamandrivorans TaxID=1357716 RepID=A0ABQ8F1E9_9FUNG|nr:hypothetical protein BASA50_009339 [Batrachochytrium salamandrivorans]